MSIIDKFERKENQIICESCSILKTIAERRVTWCAKI